MATGAIRLIIFDLDGVLCDTRPLHFAALNAALHEVAGKEYVISSEEHAARFDGLPTTTKLNMLTADRHMDPALHTKIWQRKQDLTRDFIRDMPMNVPLRETLRMLRGGGNGGSSDRNNGSYKLYVASNAIRTTLEAILEHLQIAEFFDATFSATDVTRPKPHPEIYMKAVLHAGLSPREVMICEDSPIGRRAALESGCHVCPIESPATVTLEFLKQYLVYFDSQARQGISQPPWLDKRLNVVIPMAGAGSRFTKAGYKAIKPLIDVLGKPMIQRVIENLNLVTSRHIFLCQQRHMDEYHLDMVLPWFLGGSQRKVAVVAVPDLTEGAAVTLMAAEAEITDLSAPLLIANSDQFVEDLHMTEFMYRMQAPGIDAGIVVFDCPDRDPKWSYAAVDLQTGWVTEVAEKRAISSMATVGIYYWKRASDFFRYTKSMISKNIRTNNEFYVCPVFNEAIADGKHVAVFKCGKMWGLGTPEDLSVFLGGGDNRSPHFASLTL